MVKEIENLILVCIKEHHLLQVGRKYNANMSSDDYGKYHYLVFFEDGNCSEFNVKDKPGYYDDTYLIPLAEWREGKINEILVD